MSQVIMDDDAGTPERVAWVLPEALEPFRDVLDEVAGGNDVESLMTEWMDGGERSSGALLFSNLPRYLIMLSVATRVGLLTRLLEEGRLSGAQG